MFLRNFLLISFFAFYSIQVWSQITIIPTPSFGVQSINQLGQIGIAGSSEFNGTQAVLKLKIINQDGNTVVENFSDPFQLELGENVFRPFLRFSSQPAFSNTIESQYLQNTGRFLKGRYLICYSIYELGSNNVLARYCNENYINISQVLPTLVYPYDGQSIVETRPHFIWTPLIPSGEDIRYFIEVFASSDIKGFSDTYNDLIFEGVFASTNLRLPNYIPPFKPGINYTWRVTTLYFRQPIAETETWNFTIEEIENEKPDRNSCINFGERRKTNQLYLNQQEVICVVWPNLDHKSVLYYEFGSEAGKLHEIQLTSGINYIEINIPKSVKRESRNSFLILSDGKKVRSVSFNFK